MKTNRDKRLELKVKLLRDELHRTKQKVRDTEKSRDSYKEKLRERDLEIGCLKEDIKKKRYPRVSAAAKECAQYLREEFGKLNSEDSVWHISSDVIESIFGVYKERKSLNALHGVTGYILLLPVLTKTDPQSGRFCMDVKSILEDVFLRDIDKWKKDNLSENLAVKRKNILNAA